MNKFLKSIPGGMLLGLLAIIVGFGVISLLFELLVNAGIMDEAGGSSKAKRTRTIWLLAICINIVIIQFFNKRAFHKTQRGVAIISVLTAFAWVIYYMNTLFQVG